MQKDGDGEESIQIIHLLSIRQLLSVYLPIHPIISISVQAFYLSLVALQHFCRPSVSS